MGLPPALLLYQIALPGMRNKQRQRGKRKEIDYMLILFWFPSLYKSHRSIVGHCNHCKRSLVWTRAPIVTSPFVRYVTVNGGVVKLDKSTGAEGALRTSSQDWRLHASQTNKIGGFLAAILFDWLCRLVFVTMPSWAFVPDEQALFWRSFYLGNF